ncbi:hypothetical protein GCM10010317_077070 [Streptomyces mirabilis]|uniref:hypothetical protein n=1 Tax=Streptomyces mirabilis TaxID=68239 RepID=UPI00167E671D|nr:hypothetical protein [Streptomyces mirabilis]GHD70222.1 hypothetical protein GCM10010317_077070 [Streptomyces mirabilis]
MKREPMNGDLFSYQGSARIGGVAFDEVSLHERREPFRALLWSWEGTAAIPYTAWPPPLFGMPDTPTLKLELPDGRTGDLCASARCDDGRWILEISGEGPVPEQITRTTGASGRRERAARRGTLEGESR